MLSPDEGFLKKPSETEAQPCVDYSGMQRSRPWTEVEGLHCITWRKMRIPLIAIATKLNREQSDVDYRLAQLGHQHIRKGVSAQLVMETLGFTAFAYQRAVDHQQPFHRGAIDHIALLAEELRGTYGGIKCASGRPVIAVADELSRLIALLEISKA